MKDRKNNTVKKKNTEMITEKKSLGIKTRINKEKKIYKLIKK